MIIYEKNNKLHIKFNNSVVDDSDITIQKTGTQAQLKLGNSIFPGAVNNVTTNINTTDIILDGIFIPKENYGNGFAYLQTNHAFYQASSDTHTKIDFTANTILLGITINTDNMSVTCQKTNLTIGTKTFVAYKSITSGLTDLAYIIKDARIADDGSIIPLTNCTALLIRDNAITTNLAANKILVY